MMREEDRDGSSEVARKISAKEPSAIFWKVQLHFFMKEEKDWTSLWSRTRVRGSMYFKAAWWRAACCGMCLTFF